MTLSKTGIKLSLLITALFVISTIALAVALVFTLKSSYAFEDIEIEDIPPPSALQEDFEFRLPKSKLGIYPKAAVATDTRPCAHVGTDIFRKNGTAVDAAIAVLICNGAIHSHSLGLGGGFFMIIFIKSEGKSYFLNAREMAPLASTEKMYSSTNTSSTNGPLAIAVPGELKGYVEAKNRFGNPQLSLMDLLKPTIELCERGFKVTRSLAKTIESFKTKTKYDKNLREEFTNPKTGKYFKKGETIKRPMFAKTLKQIGENGTSDIFYHGSLGEKIVKEIQSLKGIITMEDLKSYKVSWEEPLSFKLSGGQTLYTATPPSSGAIVGGTLKILDHFGYHFKPNLNEESLTIYRYIEATKFAFAQRTKLGDWKGSGSEINQAINETVQYIQSKRWLKWLLEKWNDTQTSTDSKFYGADFQYVPEDDGTSHISILAPNGDAVSATSTINTWFGSGIMSPSTRIVFNNEMDDFSTPNTTNIYGIPASKNNFIKPQKRPTSSMSPSILVDENGRVKLVVGASGGPRIITGITYTILRHLYMNEDIKTAIDCPRPHHQLVPMKIDYEIGVKQDIANFLKDKNHKINTINPYFGVKTYVGARVQAVSVDNNGIITANNDRRKEGEVDGL